MRTDQIGDLVRTVIQRLKEELRVSDMILVWRLLQQFHPLLGRRLFLFRCVSKAKMMERFFFVEPQAIEKRILGARAMPEHDVTELVREDGRKAGLVGSTSTKPRLKTMVWPIVKDSIVEVIRTRQRTVGCISRLLVTSRFLITVSSTLSTSHTAPSDPTAPS